MQISKLCMIGDGENTPPRLHQQELAELEKDNAKKTLIQNSKSFSGESLSPKPKPETRNPKP